MKMQVRILKTKKIHCGDHAIITIYLPQPHHDFSAEATPVPLKEAEDTVESAAPVAVGGLSLRLPLQSVSTIGSGDEPRAARIAAAATCCRDKISLSLSSAPPPPMLKSLLRALTASSSKTRSPSDNGSLSSSPEVGCPHMRRAGCGEGDGGESSVRSSGDEEAPAAAAVVAVGAAAAESGGDATAPGKIDWKRSWKLPTACESSDELGGDEEASVVAGANGARVGDDEAMIGTEVPYGKQKGKSDIDITDVFMT